MKIAFNECIEYAAASMPPPIFHLYFPPSTFHFPLSTFHFPLSTFHFPLLPLSHRPAQIAGMLRTIAARHAIEVPPNLATIVSIARVQVSGDLSYADVYVSAITGSEAAVKFLTHRKGEMRAELARHLQAHRAPLLRFHIDEEGERVTKLERVLESLKKI